MKKVFLDLDYSYESIIALEYAIKSEEIEVIGISSVHGKYNSKFAFDKFTQILKSLDSNVSILCGADLPFSSERLYVDGFSHDFSTSTKSICKDIYEIVKDEDEVYYICLAPATNLYDLLLNYDLKDKLKIISAAGSFAFGSVSACSEHRVYFDAQSFNEVINMGYDFTLLPLDSCCDYYFSDTYINKLTLSTYLDEIKCFPKEETFLKKNTMRSALAINYVINSDGFEASKCKCAIEVNSSLTHGMSVVYLNDFDGIFKQANGEFAWTLVTDKQRNINYIKNIKEETLKSLDKNYYIQEKKVFDLETPTNSAKKTKIILDVDTGIDDTISIFCALMSEKVDVIGITCSYGNTYIDNVVKNTINALKACNKNIPIGIGASKPWKKSIRTSPFIHGASGIGPFVYPYEDEQVVLENAWDMSNRLLEESEEKVVIVALGPCTNVATLIKKYPKAIEKIDKVVYMGGELRADTAGSQVSSVNIFHDAEAAKYLIESNVDFHMCCSTQVTDHVALSYKEIEKNILGDNVVSKASREMLYHYFKTCDAVGQNGDAKLALHDPATLMYVIEPECFKMQRVNCRVDQEGLETYGYTLIDYLEIEKSLPKNMVLVKVDMDKVDFLSNEIVELLNKYN